MNVKQAVLFVVAGAVLGFSAGFAFLPRIYPTQTIVDEYHRRLSEIYEGPLKELSTMTIEAYSIEPANAAREIEDDSNILWKEVVTLVEPFAKAGEPNAATLFASQLFRNAESEEQECEALSMILEAAKKGQPYAHVLISTVFGRSDGFDHSSVMRYVWAKEAAHRDPTFRSVAWVHSWDFAMPENIEVEFSPPKDESGKAALEAADRKWAEWSVLDSNLAELVPACVDS